MSDLPDHVRKNRAKWDDLAKEYAAAGERGWKRDTPVWGIWHVPEAELHMLPDDLNGKDAIELGCGTSSRLPRVLPFEKENRAYGVIWRDRAGSNGMKWDAG